MAGHIILRFGGYMLKIILFPLRALAFLIGYISYNFEIASDWLVGTTRKSQYLRKGSCNKCGRCCRLLALQVPRRLARFSGVRRMISIWHKLVMNFNFEGFEEGWMLYSCGYFDQGKGSSGGCSIYPFRHRICRFFPRQKLYGHPSLDPECGYRFVGRKISSANFTPSGMTFNEQLRMVREKIKK